MSETIMLKMACGCATQIGMWVKHSSTMLLLRKNTISLSMEHLERPAIVCLSVTTRSRVWWSTILTRFAVIWLMPTSLQRLLLGWRLVRAFRSLTVTIAALTWTVTRISMHGAGRHSLRITDTSMTRMEHRSTHVLLLVIRSTLQSTRL